MTPRAKTVHRLTAPPPSDPDDILFYDINSRAQFWFHEWKYADIFPTLLANLITDWEFLRVHAPGILTRGAGNHHLPSQWPHRPCPVSGNVHIASLVILQRWSRLIILAINEDILHIKPENMSITEKICDPTWQWPHKRITDISWDDGVGKLVCDASGV